MIFLSKQGGKMSEIKPETALEILNNIKQDFDSFVDDKERSLSFKRKTNIMSSVKFIVSLLTLEWILTIIFVSLALNAEMVVLKWVAGVIAAIGIIGSTYDIFKWIKLRTGFYSPLAIIESCRRKKYWKLFKNRVISVNILKLLKENMEETYVVSLIHKHNFNITYKDITDDMHGLKIRYAYWQVAKNIYDCI